MFKQTQKMCMFKGEYCCYFTFFDLYYSTYTLFIYTLLHIHNKKKIDYSFIYFNEVI